MNYAIEVLKEELKKLKNWQSEAKPFQDVLEAVGKKIPELEQAIHILEREESLDHLRNLHDQIERHDNS